MQITCQFTLTCWQTAPLKKQAWNPSSYKQGNKKCVTVQLALLADSMELPLYVILNSRIMPKKQLFTGIILRCHMSVNLIKDWLNISWNRTQRMLFIKNMLVLDPFKQHLTTAMKNTIQEMNTSLQVIPQMMSQPQVSDVLVKKSFKDPLNFLIFFLSKWLLAGDHALIPTGKVKKPSLGLLCH